MDEYFCFLLREQTICLGVIMVSDSFWQLHYHGRISITAKKKYIPLIAIILLGATFHASALLMIPIIFIVQGKAWNKKSVLCILGCIFNINICKSVYRWNEQYTIKYTIF